MARAEVRELIHCHTFQYGAGPLFSPPFRHTEEDSGKETDSQLASELDPGARCLGEGGTRFYAIPVLL